MSPKDRSKKRQELVSQANEHRGRLLEVVGRKIRDKVEAEDITQDVLAEFLETYDVGTVIESVGAWLYRVAANKIVDRFRKKKHENAYNQEALADSEPFSEEPWSNSWLREEMADAIDSLPEEQRHVFVMHELEGKSFEEISKETGIGVNTLLSRKRYAVLALREILKEVYDELE